MSIPKKQKSGQVVKERKKLTIRQIIRLVIYGFAGLLLVFFLILYLLYLSAQKEPEFYRDAINVPEDVQKLRSAVVVDKIVELNNNFQSRSKSWSGEFTDDEINAYLAIEATKSGSKLLPSEVSNPRIAFAANSIMIASRIRQSGVSVVLNISFSATLPEPNKLIFKMRTSQLGSLPLSKEYVSNLAADVFRRQWGNVTPGTDGGEPTFTIQLNLKNSTGKKVNIEHVEIQEGVLRFAGTTE
ncbi:MAG: hypothetical protein LBQ66_09285 [Planctomycetaceae bacterium]|jgi:hypothetical protein|nr:hypothetical protein [Planctomycetaceae bacterium]